MNGKAFGLSVLAIAVGIFGASVITTALARFTKEA